MSGNQNTNPVLDTIIIAAIGTFRSCKSDRNDPNHMISTLISWIGIKNVYIVNKVRGNSANPNGDLFYTLMVHKRSTKSIKNKLIVHTYSQI